jgi:hypothetical protein
MRTQNPSAPFEAWLSLAEGTLTIYSEVEEAPCFDILPQLIELEWLEDWRRGDDDIFRTTKPLAILRVLTGAFDHELIPAIVLAKPEGPIM